MEGKPRPMPPFARYPPFLPCRMVSVAGQSGPSDLKCRSSVAALPLHTTRPFATVLRVRCKHPEARVRQAVQPRGRPGWPFLPGCVLVQCRWAKTPTLDIPPPSLAPCCAGLGRTFLYPFPRDVQRILFSAESGADSDFIIAKDSEGIDISISCSLQYTVNRNRGELKALFERFGSLQDALTDTPEIADKWGWTPFFISYTRATVRDVMSRYNATSLWKDRASLSRDMRSDLTAKLGEHHVQVRGFQLLNMDIPAELQNSIISTTVEAEAVLRARENLRAINATVVTDVAVQSRLAEIDLLVAQAAAAEVEAGAQARNESLVLSIAAQVEAVSSLKQCVSPLHPRQPCMPAQHVHPPPPRSTGPWASTAQTTWHCCTWTRCRLLGLAASASALRRQRRQACPLPDAGTAAAGVTMHRKLQSHSTRRCHCPGRLGGSMGIATAAQRAFAAV